MAKDLKKTLKSLKQASNPRASTSLAALYARGDYRTLSLLLKEPPNTNVNINTNIDLQQWRSRLKVDRLAIGIGGTATLVYVLTWWWIFW